ncbi:MAG: serine hydrolase domain-containing protein [Candidatus Thorarchaeota archaeon]
MAVLGCILLMSLQPIANADLISYWPTEIWQQSTPDEQFMNSAMLETADELMENASCGVRSFIVVRNDFIVHETYYSPYNTENHTQYLYSATKGIVSLLIGMAIYQGFIDNVSQKLVNFFPDRTIANLDAQKEAITLEHLLTMTSGLEWDEDNYTSDNDMFQMRETDDWIQYILDRPMAAKPGTTFNYNSGCSHLLSGIINATTGMTPLEFAAEHLFTPLGIERYGWLGDRQGLSYGGSDLTITPRAMAKIGLLYLKGGTWENQNIVSSAWINQSVTPQSHADNRTQYGWQRDYYGYQWWVHSSSGFYAAQGREGQHIYVIPEHDIVVTFTGHVTVDEYPFSFDDVIREFVIAAIIPIGGGPQTLPLIGILAGGAGTVLIIGVVIIFSKKT